MASPTVLKSALVAPIQEMTQAPLPIRVRMPMATAGSIRLNSPSVQIHVTMILTMTT